MRPLLLLALLLGAAGFAFPQDADEASTPEAPTVAALGWLEGRWLGSDGQSRWESVYSSAEGGQILSASKELRGEQVVMIDFEHFYVREGAVRLTPFPFGRRSVEFTLTELDLDARRVVFENLEHDFPQRFEYHRSGEKALRITLTGEQGGQPLEVTLALERVGGS